VIDWKLVARLASSVAGEPAGVSYAGKDLGPLARDASERILAYTSIAPTTPLPEPELVSRRGWIDANIEALRPVFASLENRLPSSAFAAGPLGDFARTATGTVLSAELGALVGYLSQRVLGQYDIPLLDPNGESRLLLVVPNLVETAERLDADRDDLLRWVTLHEITHAVQFGGVPWLRPLMADSIKQLLEALELRLGKRSTPRVPSARDIQKLVESARRGELAMFAVGRKQRPLIERLQTTMAVVEGHAEHVMDAVGEQVVPTLPQLRAGLERKRAGRSTPLRLLERLIGLELKMRQYRDGKRFCDMVVGQGGIGALDRVWESQSMLPSAEELVAPDRWLARTARPAGRFRRA
jgi:coenzyme F420 biosynthesis associated uncharacterized protein